ncbi:MAG: hypothetical protein K1X56_07725 [Flavobacteriales bacterium]|nr:hypothetical protein [Flavobacteriales bacterium]
MKKKSKIRWEDRVFNFILKSTKYLIPSLISPQKEQYSYRFVSREENKIFITTNSTYLYQWALGFIAIGILILYGLVSQSPQSLLYFFPFPLLFILPGIIFMKRAYENLSITIDGDNKKIIYNNSFEIPFYTVKELVKSTVVYYKERRNKLRGVPSWSISIRDYKENEILLLTTENEEQLDQFIAEIRELTGIRLKEGFEVD